MQKLAERFAQRTASTARLALRTLVQHRHNVAQLGSLFGIVLVVFSLHYHLGLILGFLCIIAISAVYERTGGDSGTW